MMNVLELKLMNFLEEVMKLDIDLGSIDPEGDLFEHFNFDGSEHEVPTTEDIQRTLNVCEISDEETARNIWNRTVSDHYEMSYISDYQQRAQNWIEKKLAEDFKELGNFFTDEAAELGIPNVSAQDELTIQLDWINNKLIITGNLNVLEAAVIACINGYGMFIYDSYDEFKSVCSSKTQQGRIISHLHWLKYLEEIYGSSYEFFQIKNLSELDRYCCLGDTCVTDEELRETYLNLDLN